MCTFRPRAFPPPPSNVSDRPGQGSETRARWPLSIVWVTARDFFPPSWAPWGGSGHCRRKISFCGRPISSADLSGPEWGGMAEGEQSDRRAKVLADYRKTLLQHKEVDAKARRPSTSTACAGCARCRRALPCSPRRAGAVDARGGEEAAQGLRQDGGRPQGAAVGRADHRRGASPAAELRRPRPRPRRRLVRRSQTPVSSSPPARPAARPSLLRPRALVASSPWLR